MADPAPRIPLRAPIENQPRSTHAVSAGGHDFAGDATLVLAGEDLGLRPYPGETAREFALRITDEIERIRQRKRAGRVVRVGVSLALSVLGLGWL